MVSHFGLVLVCRLLRFSIVSLVVAMSMCSEIFVEICRHWLRRLALARSNGGSRRSVVVIYASFPTVGGEESPEFLGMVENFLQN